MGLLWFVNRAAGMNPWELIQEGLTLAHGVLRPARSFVIVFGLGARLHR